MRVLQTIIQNIELTIKRCLIHSSFPKDVLSGLSKAPKGNITVLKILEHTGTMERFKMPSIKYRIVWSDRSISVTYCKLHPLHLRPILSLIVPSLT